MLSCLPLILGFLVFRRFPGGTRERVLIAAVLVALWGAAGAELLSMVHAFSRIPVIVWWTVPIVVLAVLPKSRAESATAAAPVCFDAFPKTALLAIALLLALTFPIALLTPPTTWDGIGYHMPRQVYWIQNHTVAFYPSGDLRQLEMPPLAEYLGAQLMLLSGTDHQANLIQWLAYALTAVAASVIARDLGGGSRAQALAAALALLNPAAATQALNPKNDILLSLWLLILIWSAIRIWTTRRCSLRDAILIGITLGLALLTKGTAFAFALPVCILIALACLRASARRAIPLGFAMILLAAALNAPHWTRNARTFGSPLGLAAEEGGFPLANITLHPAAIASTFLRNLTLHTSTGFPSLDAHEQATIEALHNAAGLDPSDPRTTIRNQKYSIIPRWFSDGASGAPIHLLLGIGLTSAVCFRRWRPPAAAPAYAIPLAAAILFAAALKWQPWHARLHIPIVAVAAPFIAMWLAKFRILPCFTLLFALALAVAGVLYNESKPLIGPASIITETRSQIMFQSQPNKLPDALATIDLLAKLKPHSLALEIERATCEYPVQRLILDRLHPAPHMRVLRRLMGPQPERLPPPDAAITLYPNLPTVIEDAASHAPLRWVSGDGRFRIYVPLARLNEARRLLPIPAFFGYESEEGLLPFEGPYPQWDLPTVRWADKPAVTLSFRSDGEPMLLLLECRRNQRQDQSMQVELNGTLLLRHDFGASMNFASLRAPLQSPAGLHTVTIRFSNLNEPEIPHAALFKKLQIVPASWLDSPTNP